MSALIAILLPMALLVLLLTSQARTRALLYRVIPWTPLILLWPLLTGGIETLPLVLLGLTLGVDDAARPILWLTASAWSLCGWFAAATVRERHRWFWSGWLGALTGMNLLLLAGDLAGFYVGYATLSLSAYLLVTHAQNSEAWRAGRIYLVMALAGEAAILAGVLMIAGLLGNAQLAELPDQVELLAGSPARWLLFAGFAVKLGILPLHIWLPLAHPVAPVPASAILSGIIVKAGLMGWLRLVPASADDPALIGQALVALGLLTAFGGVALGLMQARLKTVLAYSTISQMGLLLVGFGILLLSPDSRDAMLPVLGLIALHHGLNKAALFIACGSAPGASRWRLLLFILPALALAAAPLSTGDLAKGALKDAVHGAPLLPLATTLLALSSTATALLLWKALGLARGYRDQGQPLSPAWPLLVASALLLPWAYALTNDLIKTPSMAGLIDAAWPLLLAAALIAIKTSLLPRWQPRLPEGDVVVLFERLAGAWPKRRGNPSEAQPVEAADSTISGRLAALETAQRGLPVTGLVLLIMILMLLASLLAR